MLKEFGNKARYVAGIRRFLRDTTSPARAREQVQRALATREESFLLLAERAVYANPTNPYLALLRHAGIELEDLTRLVRGAGLDAATAELYDRGVYVTYEELRCRTPIRRDGLELRPAASDFDNPLLDARLEASSSGSRGTASRSFTDLTSLAHEAAYFALLFEAHAVGQRPVAIWRPMPPSMQGLNAVLRYARIGRAPSAWFSQSAPRSGSQGLSASLLIATTTLSGRVAGSPLPKPSFLPQDRVLELVAWLARLKALGTPALVDSSASAATRLSIAARENGIDIAGTVFRVGSEPYTPAKAAAIAAAGALAIDGYAASELGIAGVGCADPAALDDMHLATDRVHAVTREKAVGDGGATVPALAYTTLLLNSRKVMINAEIGDYGDLEVRDCGCALGAAGLTTHVSGLHGYDKLTSEGMTFMGSDLFTLVEEVLPSRFGGHPTDYQLAEEEDEQGLTRVNLVVAPSVGELDETAVLATVLEALRRYDGPYRGPLGADQWRQGRTLRLIRREPFASGDRKILPLHIRRGQTASKQAP